MKKVINLSIAVLTTLSLQAGWQEAQKVVEGSGDGSVEFGYSVAMDNGYAVVGAPVENALYIFRKDSVHGWLPMQSLESSDFSFGTPYDGLDLNHAGTSVDIVKASENDVALITGDPEATIKYTGTCSLAGTPYPCPKTTSGSGIAVFELNTTSGNFESTYFVPADYNETGHDVSISYKYDVIFYSQNDWGIYIPHYGNVLFASTGYPANNEVKTFWHLPTKDWHTISTTNENGDSFGASLSLDRSSAHLIVGDPTKDTKVWNGTGYDTYYERGAVHIYKLEGSYLAADYNWTTPSSISQSTYTLHGMRLNQYTHFGQSVDIRNDKAIVGSEVQNTTYCLILPCTPKGGEADILALTDIANNTWSINSTLFGSGISGNDDSFAQKVAIDANTTVVSAPTYNGNGTRTVGAVYVFENNGTSWSEQQRIEDTREGSFGSGIAVDNGEILIGNSAHDEATWYQYHEDVKMNPSIIMYLLN